MIELNKIVVHLWVPWYIIIILLSFYVDQYIPIQRQRQAHIEIQLKYKYKGNDNDNGNESMRIWDGIGVWVWKALRVDWQAEYQKMNNVLVVNNKNVDKIYK